MLLGRQIAGRNDLDFVFVPDGDADPPTATHAWADIPDALFSDITQAQQALIAVHVCKEQLEGILRAARHGEPHHEALKTQKAIAKVVQDLGQCLISRR